MSSGVEADGIIAAAVMLPAAAAAAAYGAGWLAWQTGKLIIDANRAVDRQVAEKKRQLEEAARHRKMVAAASHRQLVDMCSQILSELETGKFASSTLASSEIEQLKKDLMQILSEPLPDDADKIESITSLGYLKLDKAVRRQSQIASLVLTESESGLYSGLSVADLMDDLRVAIAATEVHETKGADVKAADPVVLERVKLNERFADVTGKIMEALEFTDGLTSDYGLTASGSAWLHSCFNGVDVLIETLCRPTTSNKELKKGIRRLEESLEQYEMMAPSIEREVKKMTALYKVYTDASKVLGEPVESIRSFKSSAELEEKLRLLQKRAEKAKECAAIYEKLGPAAYLCYAWDQELKAMGYGVHTRKQITEMALKRPERAKLGESELPFYQWNEEDLTQLYSITSQCALQVIVHEDGTVSMQTIADSESSEAVSAQESHCAQLKKLHERLRKNWFIIYDYEETESPEKVTTAAAWRASDDFAWSDADGKVITDRRAKGKNEKKTRHIQ